VLRYRVHKRSTDEKITLSCGVKLIVRKPTPVKMANVFSSKL